MFSPYSAASLAFIRGQEASTVRKNGAAFQIVEIRVIGLVTPDGIRPAAYPRYFALFRIEERIAGLRRRLAAA